jgi:RNA polymerase sigma-70 factor (ECF subfamily)
MKTWETVPPKEPRDYLFAYLSKIMRNRCIDRIKSMDRIRRGATVTVLSDELSDAAPSGDSSDSLAIENELSALIEEFLRDLKRESRDIFIMRYFYFEELIDIARHLDITVGKVKTVLKRTRDALREHLEAYGYHA